tara:strand:- start:1716 stop:2279 length:564 start_codon:yes stop_codon:yes gene_type:complete
MSKPLLRIVERETKGSRPYVIINPFTGRGIPLDHQLLQEVARTLALKLNLDGVDYIVGFAEQGLIPAYTVAAIAEIPFIGSTRSRLKNDETEIHFIEPHSERPDHYVYGIRKEYSVVIVEDEITKCKTLYNAVTAFQEKGIKVQDIGALIMAGEVKDLQKLENKGLDPKYIFTKQDFIHSLDISLLN